MQLMRKIQFNHKTVPWFLAGASVLAFGLLIPWLGFYQDDWNRIYYFVREGNDGLRRYFFYDSRPFAFILDQSLFGLLGVNPVGWHILMLVLRYFTALVLLKGLNLVWPQSAKANTLTAVLFMIYPAYMLQSMSVVYALQWTMFLVYLISIWFMLRSIQQPRHLIVFTVISLLLTAFHLLMVEYFVGLELLRPVFLYLTLGSHPLRERLLRTFRKWIPYLLVLIAYVIFRLSFSQLFGYDRNIPEVALGLFTQPLPTIGYLFQSGLQDFVQILFAAWYETLQPSLFTFAQIASGMIWLFAAASFAMCWFYLSHLHVSEADADRESDAKQMVLLGLFAVLCGLLPGWAVGKTVFTSNPLWNDRFAMASMWGAAMVWVGFLKLLIHIQSRRIIVFSLLVALAVGANLRTALAFKQSWEKQTRFYWQLFWRAPSIEPSTAMISDSEFLFYMGVYPTSFALNTLYPKSVPAPDMNYWLFASGEHTPAWNDFRLGAPLGFQIYASQFEGLSTNSLAIDFAPEKKQCLWILSPEDVSNRSLPALAYEFMPASNLDRIHPLTADTALPDKAIFGSEPPHDWCFYFERADLARQSGSWEEIIQLWQSAQEAGLNTDTGYELRPFIEAHAYTNDWKTARALTLHADRITGQMPPFLCGLWDTLEKNTLSSPQRDESVMKVREKLHCEEE